MFYKYLRWVFIANERYLPTCEDGKMSDVIKPMR